jgi:hypothetical protein
MAPAVATGAGLRIGMMMLAKLGARKSLQEIHAEGERCDGDWAQAVVVIIQESGPVQGTQSLIQRGGNP